MYFFLIFTVPNRTISLEYIDKMLDVEKIKILTYSVSAILYLPIRGFMIRNSIILFLVLFICITL